MYGYTPGVRAMRRHQASASRLPESNVSSRAVAVCGTRSRFRHTSVSPTRTVSADGENAKARIVTAWVVARGKQPICAEATMHTSVPLRARRQLARLAVIGVLNNSRTMRAPDAGTRHACWIVAKHSAQRRSDRPQVLFLNAPHHHAQGAHSRPLRSPMAGARGGF